MLGYLPSIIRQTCQQYIKAPAYADDDCVRLCIAKYYVDQKGDMLLYIIFI